MEDRIELKGLLNLTTSDIVRDGDMEYDGPPYPAPHAALSFTCAGQSGHIEIHKDVDGWTYEVRRDWPATISVMDSRDTQHPTQGDALKAGIEAVILGTVDSF